MILPFVMWFVVTIFYAYQYVLRIMPSTIMPGLVEKFSVTPSDIGVFSGTYYIGYTVMHIPISILITRLGVKKVLPVFVTLTSFGLLPLLYAHSWKYAILGQLIVGMASSAAVLGIFQVVHIAFGEKKFSSILGISTSIGLLGAAYCGGPIGYLVEVLGWQHVLQIFFISGICLALLIYIFLPALPPRKQDGSYNIKQVVCGMCRDIITVISNGKIVSFSLIGGLMVGPLEGFADAWSTMFFQQRYDLTAGMLSSIMFLGMCIGCPLLGYLAERINAYEIVILLSAVVIAICFFFVLSGLPNVVTLYVLMFVMGIFCAYQVVLLAKVRQFIYPSLGDLASTVSNMIIMVFGFIFHNAIGFFMELISPTGGAIVWALAIIPIAMVIAIIMLMVFMFFNKRVNAAAHYST